ncbi:MAG TPA: hypothetical protein VF658_03965 [Pyrinomonadaceae bacterium]
MVQPRSFTVQGNVRDGRGLSAFLEHIMDGERAEFPNLRIAPDVTINYIRDGEVLILDVYANVGLVKERVSGTTWRVAEPIEFQSMVQQNLL